MSFNNVISLISVLTSLHFFVSSFYFFSKTKKDTLGQNFIFGSILLLLSILVLSNKYSIIFSNSFLAKPLFILRHLTLIIVPLIFLYLKTIINKKRITSNEYFKHFSLFIFSTPIICVLLLLEQNFNMFNSPLRFVSGILILFQNFLYLYWSIQLLKKNKEDKATFQKLKWFRVLLFSFVFLWSVQFCSFVLIDLFRNTNICPYTNGMYFITFFFITYLVMFFLTDNGKINVLKYSKSRLSETESKQLFDNIISDFEVNKSYRDNDMSLVTLASKFNKTSKEISQAINANFNANFNDFVNSYRLTESKELLQNNSKQELTVSQIYYLVGFNSKSTFNTLFKKSFGITPSQFRKSSSI